MQVSDLPEGIRQSIYLSPEVLNRIAGCGDFPKEKDLFQMRPVPAVQYILDNFAHDFAAFEREMHTLAAQETQQNNEWYAFKLLMIVEYSRESLV